MVDLWNIDDGLKMDERWMKDGWMDGWRINELMMDGGLMEDGRWMEDGRIIDGWILNDR
jgi:hypothetical protein